MANQPLDGGLAPRGPGGAARLPSLRADLARPAPERSPARRLVALELRSLADIDVEEQLEALLDALGEVDVALVPPDVEALRCWVVGTRCYHAAIARERLVVGTAAELWRDPNSRHDDRAIAVCTPPGAKLGYAAPRPRRRRRDRPRHAQPLRALPGRLARRAAGLRGGPRHPRLRRRHAHVPIDTEMRDAWVRCMSHALDEAPMRCPTRRAPSSS